MRHALAAFSALLLLAFAPLRAADPAPAPDPLERLAGRWVMRGVIAGKPTTHDLTATWVLNRGYLQLHEVSREKDARGRPQYEAIIYVTRDARTGEVACLWLDNTAAGPFAVDGIGRATPEGDSLPFLFRDAGGEITFSNVFAFDAKADSWRWTLDNVEKGVHQPFGRVTLTRR